MNTETMRFAFLAFVASIAIGLQIYIALTVYVILRLLKQKKGN